MFRGAAILVLRIAVGALFFYSGLLKVRNPINFLEDVRGFRAFEHLSEVTGWEIGASPWEAWVAMGLPWLEIFCGAALLFGIFTRGALAILCGAILVFIAALGSAWSRGLEITCGCFGDGFQEITNYPLTIALRVGLLAVAALLLHFEMVKAAGCRLDSQE